MNHSMIESGDKVLIALSGGPDSVCLTHLLYTLQEKLKVQLYAAHLNHCIRGEEADKDEEFARTFAHSLNIPFFTKKVDVIALAAKRGISHEMAGREARYSFFNELLSEHSLDKIALAHNANDQAETILMRIMRGTGAEGLVGIRPVREDRFIRPVLCLTREEIEDYCKVHNLSPRTDKSNLEEIYTRNKIRLKVIPYIRENFNSEIISALNRLGELMWEDNDYIISEMGKYNKLYSYVTSTEVHLKKEAFNLHKSILSRLIRENYSLISGSKLNLDRDHIEAVIRLWGQGTGRNLNLPGGIRVTNRYGDLYFIKEKLTKEKSKLTFKILDKIQEIETASNRELSYSFPDFKIKLSFKLIENSKGINLKSSPNIKYFDYNKLKGPVTLRNRRDGDRFNPLGLKGSRKLKDVFIDLKLPRDQRDEVPLLFFDEDIAWIIGYKISDKFKVEDNTKSILQIKYYREV